MSFRSGSPSTEFALSLAPAVDWCEHDHEGHVVQFYGNDDYLLDELGRFVGTALIAGDAALIIATKAHREGLAQRLIYRGFEPARITDQGRYLALDASETLAQFMVAGLPDQDKFMSVVTGAMSCLESGAKRDFRLVAFGEMVALLWAEGNREGALRLEQLWNELARTRSFSLRCGYPLNSFYREDDSEPKSVPNIRQSFRAKHIPPCHLTTSDCAASASCSKKLRHLKP